MVGICSTSLARLRMVVGGVRTVAASEVDVAAASDYLR